VELWNERRSAPSIGKLSPEAEFPLYHSLTVQTEVLENPNAIIPVRDRPG